MVVFNSWYLFRLLILLVYFLAFTGRHLFWTRATGQVGQKKNLVFIFESYV